MSKSTLSDEIPHQRRLRYLLVRHRNEVMQEFHEPVRLAVLRTILRHRRQNPLGMASQHRELHQICGIEQYVRILLVRIDPFHLRAADIGPVRDGLPGRERTFVEVAHDAAQQAVVAGRYAVVVVQRVAGDGIDENLELLGIGNIVQQFRVQCVQAFDEQHGAFFQSKALAVIFTYARNEVIFRYFHGLSGNQS